LTANWLHEVYKVDDRRHAKGDNGGMMIPAALLEDEN
jgi:hypothetical protein